MAASLFRLIANSWLLGAEATMVVPLRLARLARGGKPAAREAARMVSEKAEALATLHTVWQRGDLGQGPVELAEGTVKHYLSYVRANRKRLMQGAEP